MFTNIFAAGLMG